MWRQLFSLERDHVWRQLAAVLKADFKRTGFWQLPVVRVPHRNWAIVLDSWKRNTFTKRTGVYCIRVRSQFLNRDGFWFTIYPQGAVSTARKWFGLQDVAVGHERFDSEFIIQGNDAAKLQALFDNPRIRFALESRPHLHFSIADSEHSYWGVPEGIGELCLVSDEDILDLAGLKSLCELFAATLDELCRIKTIAIDDPLVRF
jgi:hypothetical protein